MNTLKTPAVPAIPFQRTTRYFTLPPTTIRRRTNTQSTASPSPPRLDVASAVALAQANRNYKRNRFGLVSGLLSLIFVIPMSLALFGAGIFALFVFFPLTILLWLLGALLLSQYCKVRNRHKDAKYIWRAAQKAASR
jgi:hypothetical protein